MCEPDSVGWLIWDIFWPAELAARWFKELGENRLTQIRKEESKHTFLLFPYPNTGMFVEEMCLCVCVFVHAIFFVFPSFLSVYPSLSLCFLLFHLLFFNVSLLIWRWLCLPWCTSPRQRGPRAGLALLCQQLCFPFFFFPLSCLQRDERNNKKKVKIKKASVPNNKKIVWNGEREASAYS